MKSITVYCYDPITFFYTTTDTAIENPLRPNTYLLPANSTSTPFTVEDNKYPKYNKETKDWEQINDYYGSTVYSTTDGSSLVIDKRGYLPEGYTLEQGTFFDGIYYTKEEFNTYSLTPEYINRNLEIERNKKLLEINNTCDRILQEVSSNYPSYEIQTFDQQIKEAEEYIKDNTANVPLITELAKSRGIELSTLVDKILLKHEYYSKISGDIIGQRQALEDQLDKLILIDDIKNLEVVIVPNIQL